MNHSLKLKQSEIKAAFVGPDGEKFGPILSTAQVADLLGYKKPTISEWIAKKRFDGTFRKRGKHNRFWRDRVVERFFNGDEWYDAKASRVVSRRRTDQAGATRNAEDLDS
jgi:excisionase family DNA binding protein